MNSILRALNNQTKGIRDNENLPNFKVNNTRFSKVLIIGGGPSVYDNFKSVEKFIELNSNIVLIHSSSRNAMCFKNLDIKQYFCLVGNEGYRLEKVFGNIENLNGDCILPPYPRAMGTYVPSKLINKAFQLENISFTNKLSDTHTSLAIQTAIELGAKEIFLLGYDGYSGMNIGQKEQEYVLENEYLFIKAKEFGIDLISLTDTKYENIKKDSLFAHLI